MSGAVIYIKKDLKITDVEVEILAGILNLYCLIGSCAAGRTSDWIGRRYTIVVAQGILFAGAILMALATNYAFLMAARFVAGVGVGYALMIAPVYTAEMSPASSRGRLTSFTEVRRTWNGLAFSKKSLLDINFAFIIAYNSINTNIETPTQSLFFFPDSPPKSYH